MGRLQLLCVYAATGDAEIHAGRRGVASGAARRFSELCPGWVLCADKRNALGRWQPMASGRRWKTRMTFAEILSSLIPIVSVATRYLILLLLTL